MTTITFEQYLEVLEKVESETNRTFEEDARTVEYFESSLTEYKVQLENEFTDLEYLTWLEAEITDYILFG